MPPEPLSAWPAGGVWLTTSPSGTLRSKASVTTGTSLASSIACLASSASFRVTSGTTTFADKFALSGSIPAGAYASFDVNFPTDGSQASATLKANFVFSF